MGQVRNCSIFILQDAVRNGYSLSSDQNLSEKNQKLRSELIEKVKGLRDQVKSLENDRRALSTQFSETLEALKKKVSLITF